MFCYVGTEQGISYWMSKFLNNYHGFDPDTSGADAVSYFWGLMTIGGILGLLLCSLSRNLGKLGLISKVNRAEVVLRKRERCHAYWFEYLCHSFVCIVN